MPAIFKDRKDAGRQLAKKLSSYCDENTLILGMPRGGVIVAYEVARELKLPLDVIVARKIGAPGQPEFAIGAIACNDVKVFNEEILRHFSLSDADMQRMIEDEKKELNRRIRLYSGGDQLPDIEGRTVIVVDDGVATGLTALATVRAVKKMNPKRLILAAGVCAADSAQKLREEVDEVVCIESPVNFYAVGAWYELFDQTTDEEVIQALKSCKEMEEKVMAIMNKIYRCSVCGNIVHVVHDGVGTLVCCNQPMDELDEQTADYKLEKHVPVIKKEAQGYLVVVGSTPHPMEESHYIEWIELIADGVSYRKYLKPGNKPEAFFCIEAKDISAREYCNVHKLWKGKM